MRNNDELLSAAFGRSELVIKERNAFRRRAAACVSVIAVVTAITTGVFVGRGNLSEISLNNGEMVSDVISHTGNAFVLKVGAEEITPDKGVPLTLKNHSKGGLGSGSEHEGVGFRFQADLNCEGEGIETISYSINNGFFIVSEVRGEGDTVISGTECDTDCDYPGHPTNGLDQYSDSEINTRYYKEYTIGYDSQSKLSSNIYGWIGDSETEEKAFNWDYTPEQQAEVWKEIMEGVEITCTVHYTDGTSASETIVVDCQAMAIKDVWGSLASDADPEAKIAVFSFKLK